MNAYRANLRHSPNRRGYALLMVLMFNVLFLMLLGVAWRQMASALRIAKVRTEQVQRDEGVVCAMARAMHMLETGPPPTDGHKCYMKIGDSFFGLTFTHGTDPSTETWTVTVAKRDTEPSDSGQKIVDTYLPP